MKRVKEFEPAKQWDKIKQTFRTAFLRQTNKEQMLTIIQAYRVRKEADSTPVVCNSSGAIAAFIGKALSLFPSRGGWEPLAVLSERWLTRA